MPSQIEVNDRALKLSQEFRYQHVDGDTVYIGEDNGNEGISDERKLEVGDVLDSPNHVFATSVGTARLLQFSHDEEIPGEKKTNKHAPSEEREQDVPSEEPKAESKSSKSDKD